MYIENPEEDEQNQSQSSSSPAVGAGGGGASVGGTGGTASGGNPSTIQPVQPNQTNQTFATVQDYLNSNKQQGENLGNQFVSTITPGVNTAKSAIDTSTQNTQNEINSGTVTANPDLINQALSNPTSITGDQNKLAEFQKEYNAQYTGPTSFESSDQYTNAANAANQAVQTGQELGTTGGRQQLLQDVFGVYGQGNKGLDQTLLQNSSAYPNIPPLAQGFQSVQDYLNAASTTADTNATNAAATTAATKTAATTPFANELTNFQTQLNSEVSAAQQQAQTAGSAIQNDLATGNGTALAQDLGAAGVSPENVQTISQYLQDMNSDYGKTPNLSNYYTANPLTDITTANLATPEEYANAAAYQQLTGTDYSGVLNPANISQAGTAKLGPTVDSSNLQTYLQGQVKELDTEAINNAPNFTTDNGNIGAGNGMPLFYKGVDQATLDQMQTAIKAADRQGITNPNIESYKLYISRRQQANQPLTGPSTGYNPLS